MPVIVDQESRSILKLIKLPDLLTICNAIFGFYAILLVLTGTGTEPLKAALVAILSAAVIDGMDGMIARRIENSPLGRYLDSLADMLSFGTAPAVIAFALLNHTFIAAICSAYMVCGMLRLARFDAITNLSDGFEGLPITGSAVCLASFMLLSLELPLSYSSLLLSLLMAVLCILMVSRIRYGNIRDLRLVIPFGFVFFAVILLYLLHSPLIIYPAAVLAGLSVLYLCSPLLSYYFTQ